MQWVLPELLDQKRRIGFIFFSVTMYKSSSTFMKWCTKVKPHKWKVKPHKWRCDVKLVRHVEGRKEEHDEMGFAGVVWPRVMYKSLAT